MRSENREYTRWINVRKGYTAYIDRYLVTVLLVTWCVKRQRLLATKSWSFINIQHILSPTSVSIINVSLKRHPLSRLLSAWRNKFAKSFSASKKYFARYGVFIKQFYADDEFVHEDYLVSFPAFLKFVVFSHLKKPQLLNTHWMPYFQACSPCGIDYQVVSKQESSLADAQVRIHKNLHWGGNLPFPKIWPF